MSCILRYLDEHLDIDELISKTKIIPDKTFYKGQPKFKTKPEGEKIKHSGFTMVASNADFNNFNQQVKDVIEFLKANKASLKKVAETAQIQYAILDFGVEHDCEIFCQSNHLPFELLQLSVECRLSIELSVYQPSAPEE